MRRGPLPWLALLAVAAGAWLRLQQLPAQVLIDDEWHAVHQVMHHFPAAMLLDFGFADYGIPLGVLYWWEAQWFGLSELAMRWPMVACGLVTLVAFPLFVARRMGWRVATPFAALVAISPLLVVYTRMARPYAITLLLGFVAHVAFERYRSRAGGWRAAAAYVASASFATWLHPIVGPFVLAPFAYAGLTLLRTMRSPEARPLRTLMRLGALGMVTAAVIAVLVLPPLLANTHSMAAKSGIDSPRLNTLVGAAYLWLGTSSTPVVIGALVLAAIGAPVVWRALPEARTATLGVALTFVALLVTRPMFSYNPISLARYALAAAPLLLLALAAGAMRLVALAGSRHRVPAPRARNGRGGRVPDMLGGVAALMPVIALAATSPLWPMLRRPNTETLHFLYHFDFRPDHNPYRPYMARIPLSPFWSQLAREAPGTLRIAAAPFHFESFNWDAPRWEAISRQRVLPGYVTGLCVDERPGETPLTPAFRFSNAVHLARPDELARARIDYVVWQKPYDQVTDGLPTRVNDDLAACETALRARFGAPAYEDATLVAFRLQPAR